MYAGVYVGTYKKYNEGNDNKLAGKWLDMSDYDSYDDFIAACKELHKDEDEPEFMFQDFDFDSEVRPLLKQLVKGSQVDPQAWDVFELDSEGLTCVLAAWGNYDSDLSVKEALEEGRKSYIGSYDSEPGDYVYDFLEEILKALPGSVDPKTGELYRTY
ncbi:antirestriction protein ArdA [Snodgrassella sp. ESL0324]|uniref:antirestriction protein ArdA n=1 Tax=Snodgrassella sp. ESL0324 TaxID=2705033 RepID=UPI001583DB92|nr:antirestriction protein ArdA [Snodgrassella sp. ESL0324]NUF08926.1 antirestriction protein ArdA [Snodgrassella sp. ESL0324]